MKKILAIIFAALCILNISELADGIRCYECLSLDDAGCSKPGKSHEVDCPTVSRTCIKGILTAPSTEIIVRTCGDSAVLLNNACEFERAGDQSATYCECNSDLCNGASGIFTKSAVIVSVLFTVTKMFFN